MARRRGRAGEVARARLAGGAGEGRSDVSSGGGWSGGTLECRVEGGGGGVVLLEKLSVLLTLQIRGSRIP